MHEDDVERGTPTVYCPGCLRFQVAGVSAQERNAQLKLHWPSCVGVEHLWFNDVGTLVQVKFRSHG